MMDLLLKMSEFWMTSGARRPSSRPRCVSSFLIQNSPFVMQKKGFHSPSDRPDCASAPLEVFLVCLCWGRFALLTGESYVCAVLSSLCRSISGRSESSRSTWRSPGARSCGSSRSRSRRTTWRGVPVEASPPPACQRACRWRRCPSTCQVYLPNEDHFCLHYLHPAAPFIRWPRST